MRNLPPLNWLKAFESVARNKSFSLAARELNVTQSAISQHIKLLEHQLKATLFIRKSNQIILTDKAREYLPSLSHAFVTLENATESTFGNQNNVVNIQCDVAFSSLFIAPRLQDFQRRYPQFELKFKNVVWWQRSENNLRGAPAALEIRYGDENWNEASIKLVQDKICPVVHHQLYQKKPITLENLAEFSLYQLSGVQHNWWVWLSGVGYPVENSELKPVIESDCSIINHLLVQQQSGIALISQTLASHALKTGLFVKPFDHQIQTLESYHLVGINNSLNEAEQCFMEWLLEKVQTLDL